MPETTTSEEIPCQPQASCDSGRPGQATRRAVAALHADSWQRHYRGAFSDAFLDGEVRDFLLDLWVERLAAPGPRRRTILAEQDGQLAGMAHTALDDDPTWGALLDNLHVSYGLKRRGVGTRLLSLTPQAVLADPRPPACTCGSWSRTPAAAPSTTPAAAHAWKAFRCWRQAATSPGSTASPTGCGTPGPTPRNCSSLSRDGGLLASVGEGQAHRDLIVNRALQPHKARGQQALAARPCPMAT